MLFHKDIFVPQLKLPTGRQELIYSRHAIAASEDDKNGCFSLPSTINTDFVQLIEVETEGPRPVKMVYRDKYDKTNDIVFVCVPRLSGLFVKTVWLNKSTDIHQTLNTKRYNTMGDWCRGHVEKPKVENVK